MKFEEAFVTVPGDTRQTTVVTRPARTGNTKILSDRPLAAYKLPSRKSGSNQQEITALRLFLPSGRTLDVAAKSYLLLGRQTGNKQHVDVDLTPYDGVALGISRSHLLIQISYTDVFIRDLNSSNGSYLNGSELYSMRDYRLKDCDVLKLGRLKMRITMIY